MRVYRRAAHPAAGHIKTAAGNLRQPLSFISRDMVADVFASQENGRRDLSVCFTGHRHVSAETEAALALQLDALLAGLYRRGCRDFYCGGALGFDTLAAEAVIRLQLTCPEARLILALPCATQSERWKQPDCARYERILYLANRTHVLSPNYYEGCMQVRNRFMVDRSRICVCYLSHMRGGTLYTANYALDQGLTLLNLAIPDMCEKYLRS